MVTTDTVADLGSKVRDVPLEKNILLLHISTEIRIYELQDVVVQKLNRSHCISSDSCCSSGAGCSKAC